MHKKYKNELIKLTQLFASFEAPCTELNANDYLSTIYLQI